MPLHSYIILRVSDYDGDSKGIGTHEANFSLRRVESLSAKVILDRFERIQQSEKFINLSNKCNIYIKVIQGKLGGHPVKINSFSSIKEAIIAKKTSKSLHTKSDYLYNERDHGAMICVALSTTFDLKTTFRGTSVLSSTVAA